MTSEIIKPGSRQLSTHLSEVAQEARQIIAAGVPENTKRTYRSQWGLFLAWCHEHDRCPLPVSGEDLVLYLTERSRSVKVSSLQVALAAITVAHRESGHQGWSATDLPGVRIFMRGLRRQKGQKPKKKVAMTLEMLRDGLPPVQGIRKGASNQARMDAQFPQSSQKRAPSSATALRDRAVLLVGFFSALRRAELSSLDVSDVSEIPTGARIEVWGSKTDKKMEGQVVSVPRLDDHPDICPVRALQAWLEVRLAKDDSLFTSLRTGSRLSPQGIARVVKKAAKRIGMNPRDFGAHSLRSGFATSAARADAAERDIMTVTRHTSERTLRGYIHEATLGEKHPGRKIAEKE